LAQLQDISGLGVKKLEAYGPQMLFKGAVRQIILITKKLKFYQKQTLFIHFQAIVNSMITLAHRIKQALGFQRGRGDFLGFVMPVHTHSTQG
jgi:hypothetical protein